MPRIELLYWNGCPSYPRAVADLRAAAAELGEDPTTVAVREIATDHAAREERFPGSPTFRVDGRDLFPPGPDCPVGLTCRIYRRAGGQVSPTPHPDDLRRALRAALEEDHP